MGDEMGYDVGEIKNFPSSISLGGVIILLCILLRGMTLIKILPVALTLGKI